MKDYFSDSRDETGGKTDNDGMCNSFNKPLMVTHLIYSLTQIFLKSPLKSKGLMSGMITCVMIIAMVQYHYYGGKILVTKKVYLKINRMFQQTCSICLIAAEPLVSAEHGMTRGVPAGLSGDISGLGTTSASNSSCDAEKPQ